MEEKTCACCWLTKPIEEFYATGNQCYCKVCSRKRVAEWQKNNPEKVKEKNLRWRQNNSSKSKTLDIKQDKEMEEKVCGKCWLSKPLSEFYEKGNKCYCKECSRKVAMEWQQKNHAKKKAASRRWYRANKEKAKAASTKWAKEHPEKVKEQLENWRRNNPLRVKIHSNKGNFKKKMKRQELANELRST